MRHLFGPVPSRRLGASLGIDLTPAKTCSLNCLYCEAGRTTRLTAGRAEYVPVDEVLSELDAFLADRPHLDHITFSGAGEPTLHSGLGRILTHLKTRWPEYRTALLTNGTGFTDPEVRREAALCDVVIPSLDAGDEATFQRINRPCPGLTLDALVEGLMAFRSEYAGSYLLEVFLLEGVNDDPDSVAAIMEQVQRINPDEVQLNTLDRPGAETGLSPVPPERMAAIARRFEPIPTRVVSRIPAGIVVSPDARTLGETILGAIVRRPCTADDLAAMTGKALREINDALRLLLDRGIVTTETETRGTFYRPV